MSVFRDSGSSTWGEGVGALTAHDAKDGYASGLIAHSLRADGFDASEDGTGQGTPIIPIDLRQSSRGDKVTNNRANGSGGPPGVGVGSADDPAFTVSERGQAVAFIVNAAESCAKQSHARESEVARCLDSTGSFANAQGGTVVACDIRNGVESDQVATLQANGHGACPNGTPHIRSVAGVRRLTPREAERLQGFPDDWTLVPYRGKPASDGPRYKSIGNSMAVPVVSWIGQRIEIVNAYEGYR